MPASERLLKQLHRLYETLPKIDCKGWCWHSCGPIDMSNTERERLVDLGVEIPVFTEAAGQRWANNEHTDYCPAFSMGAIDGESPGCTVYEDRPTICRIWGLTESMRCPYGCEPTTVLSNLQSFELLAQADMIGGSAHGMTPEDASVFRRVLENPDAAAVMARYIEGDLSVRDEALRLMDLAATAERRKPRGRTT